MNGKLPFNPVIKMGPKLDLFLNHDYFNDNARVSGIMLIKCVHKQKIGKVNNLEVFARKQVKLLKEDTPNRLWSLIPEGGEHSF